MSEGRTLGQLTTVLEMIKFEHTVFALPFAFIGALLAAEGWPSLSQTLWIILAMIGARSAAMGFNRLVDKEIDAANPRTANRALPAGLVSPTFVALFVVGSSLLLALAAYRLNSLAFKLTPLALAIVLGYSLTKRFTSLAHLFLGLAISGAPLGAWIAIRGDVQPTPLILSGAVMCWVAGFDVLYALQDREFDRDRGLHSIPARVGEVGSLWISGLLHVAMLALLATLPSTYPPGLGIGFWIGLVGCACLLTYQHWIVRPGDLSRLNAAFFQANGLLALWLFVAIALDRLVLA